MGTALETDSLDGQGCSWGVCRSEVDPGCLSPAPPPATGQQMALERSRGVCEDGTWPHIQERRGRSEAHSFLPGGWVLCPPYRVTALFNETKRRRHQPFQKVKAFPFFFPCCLQDINKNRLIKSKAAQLDRASRKKNKCLLYNLSISVAVLTLGKSVCNC